MEEGSEEIEGGKEAQERRKCRNEGSAGTKEVQEGRLPSKAFCSGGKEGRNHFPPPSPPLPTTTTHLPIASLSLQFLVLPLVVGGQDGGSGE